MLENTAGVFSAVKNSKLVVIPPLPRYLFSGCCKQSGHSLNVNNVGYAKQLLTDTIGLQNCLKKIVCSLGLANCRVMDSCCVTDCKAAADIDTRIDALKLVTAQDSVHFLNTSYDHLVENILRTDASTTSAAASTTRVQKSHFWRGFRSTVGSSASTLSNWPSTRGHGHYSRGKSFRCNNRHHPFYPYKRFLTPYVPIRKMLLTVTRAYRCRLCIEHQSIYLCSLICSETLFCQLFSF
jgi:hypothetical protein